jgi:hypothetical protein
VASQLKWGVRRFGGGDDVIVALGRTDRVNLSWHTPCCCAFDDCAGDDDVDAVVGKRSTCR